MEVFGRRPPAAYDDRDGTEIRSKHTAAPWHMRFVPWPSGGPCARHLPFQAYKCLEKVRLKYAAFSKNTQPVCMCILGLGARAAATHARAHRCCRVLDACCRPPKHAHGLPAICAHGRSDQTPGRTWGSFCRMPCYTPHSTTSLQWRAEHPYIGARCNGELKTHAK
jgi:hypothetical protein